MKLYQDGSMYDDMVKAGRAGEVWFALFCSIGVPALLVIIAAVVSRIAP